MSTSNNRTWKEIRTPCHTFYGAEIVILIHPWRKRWAVVFAEDTYGMSPWLFQRLSVAEAKQVAEFLGKYIRQHFAAGCSVAHIDVAEAVAFVEAKIELQDEAQRLAVSRAIEFQQLFDVLMEPYRIDLDDLQLVGPVGKHGHRAFEMIVATRPTDMDMDLAARLEELGLTSSGQILMEDWTVERAQAIAEAIATWGEEM